MTSAAPTAGSAVASLYVNWRPPLVWTAVIALVEPDHLLVLDLGNGTALLPGGPVHEGLTPAQAAQAALSGAGSEQLALRPVLVDERQLTRRKVIVHTFITLPIPLEQADCLQPSDPRPSPLIICRRHALALLPRRARLRAQFALATQEAAETAHVEWRTPVIA